MRRSSLPTSPERAGTRRIGALAASAWLLAVVVTGVIASRAVAVLDTETSRPGVLSQSEVDRALTAARALATATAAPSAAPTTPAAVPPPSAAPTASVAPTVTTAPPAQPVAPPPSSRPAAVARTWQLNGGSVAASCTGTAISLLYATPADGWTVEVGATGPQHIEVELRQPGVETKVTAACVGGVPQQSVEQGTPEAGGSDQSSDG